MPKTIPDHIVDIRKNVLYELLNNGVGSETVKAYPAANSALKNFYKGGDGIEVAREHAKEFANKNIKFLMVGNSEAFKNLTDDIEKVIDTDFNVLITGETGKEEVAKAIHYFGKRGNGPFVVFNISSYSGNPELFRSDYTGRDKGAYTGADQSREGKLGMAEGGTILLNEVGDLEGKPDFQASLLEYFDPNGTTVFGRDYPVHIDTRLLASSNKDLEKMLRDGKLREDLYHRLYELRIHVPPLRERKEDIPLLVEHFLKKYKGEKKLRGISDKDIDGLRQYHWPGNVRQLENHIKRSIADGQLKMEEFMYQETTPQAEDIPELSSENLLHMSLEEMHNNLDRRVITQTLVKTGWKKSETAKKLGINYQTLRKKINQYNIKGPEPEKHGLGLSLAQAEKSYIQSILQSTNWNKSEASKRLNISRPALDGKIKKHGIEKE